MKIEPPPIKTGLADDRNLFTLPWDKWFNSLRAWVNDADANLSSITPSTHVPATVADTGSVDLTISGQQISAAVIPGGIDHGEISGLGDDDHTQYHTDARGDARYSPLGHQHTKLVNGIYELYIDHTEDDELNMVKFLNTETGDEYLVQMVKRKPSLIIEGNVIIEGDQYQ